MFDKMWGFGANRGQAGQERTCCLSELIEWLSPYCDPSGQTRNWHAKLDYPEQHYGKFQLAGYLARPHAYVLDGDDAWNEFGGTGIILKTAWENARAWCIPELHGALCDLLEQEGDLDVFVDMSPEHSFEARWRNVLGVYEGERCIVVEVGERWGVDPGYELGREMGRC